MNTPEKAIILPAEIIQPDYRLMISGYVILANRTVGSSTSPGGEPDRVEIRRGYPVLSKERLDAGKVAAIVQDKLNGPVVFLLLSRLPAQSGYLLVLPQQVEAVEGGMVRLCLSWAELSFLPEWHAAG